MFWMLVGEMVLNEKTNSNALDPGCSLVETAD